MKDEIADAMRGFDSRRVRFDALTAAIIAACNFGGMQLSWHFATERNVYGKLLLALCMILIPLFHPKRRSRDRQDARQVVADVCIAWLIGFGAETVYFVALRPVPFRLLDVVFLAGVSLALAAVSIGAAGVVDSVSADVRRIVARERLPAGVGGPYVTLSSAEEARTPTRTERWVYSGLFVLLFASIAVRELNHHQYLFAIGATAFALVFSLVIAPRPAGPVRRLWIYACACVAIAPILWQLVFA
jgi:hypothetical protein